MCSNAGHDLPCLEVLWADPTETSAEILFQTRASSHCSLSAESLDLLCGTCSILLIKWISFCPSDGALLSVLLFSLQLFSSRTSRYRVSYWSSPSLPSSHPKHASCLCLFLVIPKGILTKSPSECSTAVKLTYPGGCLLVLCLVFISCTWCDTSWEVWSNSFFYCRLHCQ